MLSAGLLRVLGTIIELVVWTLVPLPQGHAWLSSTPQSIGPDLQNFTISGETECGRFKVEYITIRAPNCRKQCSWHRIVRITNRFTSPLSFTPRAVLHGLIMSSRASCPDMARIIHSPEPVSRALRVRVGPVMHALHTFVHYHV